MTDFLVIPNPSAGELVLYDFSSGSLIEQKRRVVTTNALSSSSSVGFDRDNSFVFFTEFVSGVNDSFLNYAAWNDGDVGTSVRLTTGDDTSSASHSDISPDNGLAVFAGSFRDGATFTNHPFALVDLSGETPSFLTKFTPASGQTDQRSVRFVSNDRFIAHEGQTGVLRLYGIDSGSSITEIAEATIGSFSADQIGGFDSHLWVATDGAVSIYDFSGDVISLVDSTTPTDGPQARIRSLGGNKAWTKSGIHQFDGALVTTLAEPNPQLATNPSIAAFSGGEWATFNSAGGAGWDDRIQLYDLAGDQIVLAEDSTGHDSVTSAQFTWADPQFSTPEQKFNASYADASAADPKATALIRPADVQRSIDTDVSNLKDGPNFYTVEAIFDLGELSNLNPYNSTTEKPRVFFVKDDQPGLRDGKNLLLKGYQIRSADPSVPVTCTFWGY